MTKALPPLVPALLIASLSCSEDVRFTTEFASDFVPARRAVSVLGVYKDGRMSETGWDTLAPHIIPALGDARGCAPGYDALVSADGPLAQAIEDYTESDGPTDELLAQLAPAARGDSILVLALAGKLPKRTIPDGGEPLAPGSGTGMLHGSRMGGARAPGAARGSGMLGLPEDTSVLEISASLYSVRDARSVAHLALKYTGASLEDAVTKFAAKFAASFPQAACAGWNWDVKIDPDRIRQSAEE